jgi:hypothetical protein
MLTSSVLGDGCCPQRLSPVLAELSSADLLVYVLQYQVGCPVYHAARYEAPIVRTTDAHRMRSYLKWTQLKIATEPVTT